MSATRDLPDPGKLTDEADESRFDVVHLPCCVRYRSRACRHGNGSLPRL